MSEHYYQHHVFFCTNQRDDGQSCCQDFKSLEMRNYLKKKCKELGISGEGKVRINTAGCLDRCNEGPVCVIYPDETWYTWVDSTDIDEILQEHLMNNRVVERLKI